LAAACPTSYRLMCRNMKGPLSPNGIPNGWLVDLIESHLTRLPPIAAGWPDSPCLLADIGEYLIRCIRTLSQLADELAQGQHINLYATQTIDDMNYDTDFSDLGLLDYFDNKHASLKSLASQLQVAAQDLDIGWQHSPKPPQASTRLQKRPSRYSQRVEARADMDSALAPFGMGASSSRDVAYDRDYLLEGHEPAENLETPGSDDSIHDKIQELLSSLSSRGKGRHVCPFHSACRKGGVHRDGTVVIFKRNSAFRSHLEKHEKLYKCELPGCKNGSGFARKDQLRRHQETVPHRGE